MKTFKILFILFFIFLIYTGEALAHSDYFRYGVASGDPLQDRVIIWTRIEASEPAKVNYEVSLTPGFEYPVATGTVTTDQNKDFTVKADITGLKPGKQYYYRFRYRDTYSPSGTTATLPENTSRFRAAVLSCQNYSAGFFTAYKHLLEDKPDLLIILGDTMYEYAWSNPVRPDMKNGNLELSYYRDKHKLGRTDPYFQEALRKFPVIVAWDDHEVQNNYSGKELLEKFPERILGGYQSFFEYMPIREQKEFQTYRSFKIGKLVDLYMLDGRQYRDPNTCNVDPLKPECFKLANLPGREYLGQEQEKWFLDGVKKSEAIWKVAGNNTMISEFKLLWLPVNYDQWDGFPEAKERVLKELYANKVKNMMFITGDIHMFIATEARYNNKKIATEFVTTGVSSPSRKILNDYQDFFPAFFFQHKYFNGDHRGYTIVDFRTTRADVYFYGITDVTTPNGKKVLKRHFVVPAER